jgi:putative glutamine amidotransferase
MKSTSLPRILIAPQTEAAAADSGGRRSILSKSYAAAVRAAGGTPLIASCLPDATYVQELLSVADGLLLTGGDDLAPELYDPKVSADLRATVRIDGPERDAFEVLLVQEAFQVGKPVFGICRGMQLLNVALGGTLIVDIPSQVPHAMDHRRTDAKDQIVHDVSITSGSLLSRIVGGSTLGVNSTHHQAIDRLAKVFQPNAVSKDGIVEGFELTEAYQKGLPYMMAVQFHPERLWERFPKHLDLFRCFTTACQRNWQ